MLVPRAEPAVGQQPPRRRAPVHRAPGRQLEVQAAASAEARVRIWPMVRPIQLPLSVIAFWNRPLATGEPTSMPTIAAPADSPKIVTLLGSPPKLAMFALTHVSAAMASASA
jgi:hypothetical protein